MSSGMPTTECVATCHITHSTASISSPLRSERKATSPFRGLAAHRGPSLRDVPLCPHGVEQEHHYLERGAR
eukprot:1515655-Alexandrium_andersonii.AAC.1